MTVQLNFQDIFKIKDCYYYVEFLSIRIWQSTCRYTVYLSIVYINIL